LLSDALLDSSWTSRSTTRTGSIRRCSCRAWTGAWRATTVSLRPQRLSQSRKSGRWTGTGQRICARSVRRQWWMTAAAPPVVGGRCLKPRARASI